MGSTGSAGGGRASRVLRLLLLFVLALAAVEYLFGSILDASPLRTYLNSDKTQLLTSNRGATLNVIKPPSVNTTNAVPVTKKQNMAVTHYNQTMATKVISEPPQVSQTSILLTRLMETLNNETTDMTSSNKNDSSSLPLCELPADLGPIKANKTDMDLATIEKKFPEVQFGGRYSPPNCTARHKVAIIVPFRDRQQHLAVFVNHMHPFLMKQQIEYGIFIVEQEGEKPFNRAKLMNVGYKESQRLEPNFTCFIFHDIDLLPTDTRNVYSCTTQPRHLSAAVDVFRYKLPYKTLFGGVSAMTNEQLRKVNGYSNKYWGWGGEDDDMADRLKINNYHIARYPMSIARYEMLTHKKQRPNPKRYQLLSQSKSFVKDGLSNLDYKVKQIINYHLYTHILANIDEHS
ncbi:beta-1,4-N-acetylgalactosaminyltransferase bre-4-like [Spodoptera litura]|uniref:Beta-1,4-N-acetylgalactosaminyltransferase n=1 Tax=Spodoptera litura TaxID=69820 RepID=A0A9J7E5H2_SPOLT|nr:beta-1,4-N-acetylgalactosaminyltransferase bre-4-like [Spodoptera litura]XP_022822674.1 beta-1,4-N-acetylgalactosaminyltransferase bre-4-like [Spodoptera litura]XP_022822675.1 beta-1,4-N-acetylgalactosaminyltransferase bre-4-like [Spodoptera litura]XP_022822676.1 beta-1,4-N-acetylgalactosaminyltransferase bre-4-like [Spodoptera litura]